jgi:membrane protease YdiL (CAAX protease family)
MARAMAAERKAHALGAQGERLGARSALRTHAQPRAVVLVVAIYAAAGTSAALVSLALGHDPLSCPAWLGTTAAASWLLSLGLGVLLGAATTSATRTLVRKFRWARALHLALRPAVHGTDDAGLLLVALASAAGEELLFRGLLVQVVGVTASSIVFGALHQIRGRARWGWMAWATVMGFAFGGVFVATGSLAGPLVAHAAINHANLRFLRDNDPRPRRKNLGGLLKRP